MPQSKKLPEMPLNPQDRLHGFRVERVTPLPDIRAVACELVHEKSGAQVVHLYADDPENLLAIALRTPPPDDTGLPHILEHAVLCGSRRYPVKDPFVELLKTSLATFLNAMTYPDKTVYPCASMVEKDFFNVASVYCDAVFHPMLTEEHFKQEGHRLALADTGNPDSPLIIKGIVYNEMKGAYSDLDGIIERTVSRSICPDNAYGRDYGGDPEAIPQLTYDQFRRFHRVYYHPSNARIVLYGDVPTEKHLAFLNGTLSGFERIQIDTGIEAQPRWSQPKRERIPYPIGAHDDPVRKAAVVLTFLTNDITEALRSLAMTVLDYYLLGNAASPLRKALIDSKLGEELTDSGYAGHQRDTFFTVGLKGTEPQHADAIVDLVRTTCEKLVQAGLERNKVEAAFHRMELATREIQGHYPLHLMERMYRSWMYDADPLYNLRLEEHLSALRRRYDSEPRFFERQLEEMLLDNPHFVVLTFVPDKEYTVRREREFHEKMATMKAAMRPEELQRLAAEDAELTAKQGAPNPPEALAKLPRLHRKDVPMEPVNQLDSSMAEVDGVPLLNTSMAANGLNYLHLAFDLRGIDEDLVDYLPLFTEALRKMAAGGDDFVVMAEREAAATGGVGAGISVSGHIEDPLRVRPYGLFSSKAIDAKLPEMLQILADRVLRCTFTDLDRLRDVVLQGRVARRSQLIPNGWLYALLYAGRHLSRNGALSERIGGVSQIRLFDRLAQEFDAVHHDLVEKLERIREFIRGKGRLTASFLGSDDQVPRITSFLKGFAAELRDEHPPDLPSDFRAAIGTHEAIATPADVAFVAEIFPTVGGAHPAAPALLLLSLHLSYGYLWEEIRVKGGAYGARASYNPLNGTYGLASYRDPVIRETLKAFGGVLDYIQTRMDLSPAAVEQAVIGTLKTMDPPIRPGQAVGTALARYLNGETPEFRRGFRRQLLELSGEEIRRAAAEVLAPAYRKAAVCVLAGREKIESANAALGKGELKILDL
jgi:Zn-dependent M16 (insulinase) family peptidase